MLIEKRPEGFDGQYDWYIDGKMTRFPESEIIKLVGKEKEKEFFDLCVSNIYMGFKIEL